MAKYFVEDTSLTAVADAIRTKGGTSDALSFPDGFISAVEEIQAGGGGDTSIEDALIEGTISGEYVNNRIDRIGSYTFYGKNQLTSIVAPNVTSVGDYAFYGCSKLVSVDFFDTVVSLGRESFANNPFERIELSNLTTLGRSAFQNCKKLVSVSCPKLTTITDGYSFSGCVLLKEVNLPILPTVQTRLFSGCTVLDKIDLPCATRINGGAFNGCSSLKTIILRANSICALGTSDSLASTPFASGGTGGTVYVPSALITQYQQATNWSTLYAAGTCNFVAIEGSEYE